MFGLLSTLAEILSSCGQRFLDRRRNSTDVDIAALLLSIAMKLQELVARGERILALAATAGTPDADMGGFERMLAGQVQLMGELQDSLEESRGLLMTIDPSLYFELIPFIEKKSGLLTRWAKQAGRGRFSTTTLFFLPPADISQIREVARGRVGEDGMELDRTDYLLSVTDALQRSRQHELRDIWRATDDERLSLGREIEDARGELARTRALCGQLVDATSQAVGPEAMMGLRRRLVRD
jgi:hypothetical protein